MVITEFVSPFCGSKLIKPGVRANSEAGQLPLPYQTFAFFRPSVDT